jgi:hypothetical protein
MKLRGRPSAWPPPPVGSRTGTPVAGPVIGRATAGLPSGPAPGRRARPDAWPHHGQHGWWHAPQEPGRGNGSPRTRRRSQQPRRPGQRARVAEASVRGSRSLRTRQRKAASRSSASPIADARSDACGQRRIEPHRPAGTALDGLTGAACCRSCRFTELRTANSADVIPSLVLQCRAAGLRLAGPASAFLHCPC